MRQIRRETPEEHALNRPDGLREAILIVASFLFFYFSLIGPAVFTPAGRRRFVAARRRTVGIYAPPRRAALREIHCLRGVPKRWGLFGENDQEQINNISLGIIDLIYPRHWQPDCRDRGSRPILISISTATWPVRDATCRFMMK